MRIKNKPNTPRKSSDEIKKTFWEVIKLRLDVIVIVLGLLYIAAFSLGAILLFSYCYRYQYNPGGISAADTVSLTLLSFTFLLTPLIASVALTMGGYTVARTGHWLCVKIKRWFKRRAEKKAGNQTDTTSTREFEWQSGLGPIYIVGWLAVGGDALLIYATPSGMKMFLMALSAMGFFISFYVFGKWSESNWPIPENANPNSFDKWIYSLVPWKRRALIIIVMLSGFGTIAFSTMQDLSFTLVGFRKHDVTAKLSKEEFSQLVDRADRLRLVVNPCEPLDADFPIVNHVDVMWSKLGTNGFLRLPSRPLGADSPDERPDRQLTLEVNNSTLSTMQTQSRRETCWEFRSDELFDSSDEKLTQHGKKTLQKNLSWMKELQPDHKVRVSAHSFVSNPINKKMPGTLTLRQANAVMQFLIADNHLNPKAIESVGLENTLLKRTCSQPSEMRKKLCEASNRRIEVLVHKEAS